MNNNKFNFKKASSEDIKNICNIYKNNYYKSQIPIFKNNMDFYTKKITDDNLFENYTYICKCNNIIIGYISFYILLDRYNINNLNIDKYNFKLIYINELFSFINNNEKIDCIDKLTINETMYIFFVLELLKLFAQKNLLITTRKNEIYNKFHFINDNNTLSEFFFNNSDNLYNEIPVKKINVNSILNKINNKNNNIKY